MPDLEKVGVILVPGIFASHLSDSIPLGRSFAWPVNDVLGMTKLARATPLEKRNAFGRAEAFQASAPRFVPAGIPPERGWQTVFLSKYKPFLQRCHSPAAGELPFAPQVFASGYNFTVSNEVSALRTVRATVQELFKRNTLDTRFFFVTHSMGCLVVRRMLQLYPELATSCLGVIHVAAPNGGAPEALMRFIRGLEAPAEGLAGLAESRIVTAIFGGEGWKVCTAASRLSAGFQLLPYPMLNTTVQVRSVTHPVFEAVGPPNQNAAEASSDLFFLRQVIITNFNNSAAFRLTLQSTDRQDKSLELPVGKATWTEASRELEPMITDTLFHVAEARRLHNALAAPNGIFHRTATVSLTGVRTVQAVRFTFDAASRVAAAAEFADNNGDGTVPLASQQFRVPARTTTMDGRQIDTARIVDGTTHENALTDTRVIDDVFDLMRHFWRERQP